MHVTMVQAFSGWTGAVLFSLGYILANVVTPLMGRSLPGSDTTWLLCLCLYFAFIPLWGTLVIVLTLLCVIRKGSLKQKAIMLPSILVPGLVFSLMIGNAPFICSTCMSVSESDLNGSYVAHYRFATETLELRENGEYAQTVEIAGKPGSVAHSGRWSYDPDPWLGGVIVLESALNVQNGYGDLNPTYEVPSDGLSILGVHRFLPWSRIRLGSDELVQLIKQDHG